MDRNNEPKSPEASSNFDFFIDIDMDSKSPETLNNFDDFNNMFKGIDRDDYTPDHTASIVFRKVELERNPSRLDDAVEWLDEGHFYKIRCTLNESAHEFRFRNPMNSASPRFYNSDESEVSDIED